MGSMNREIKKISEDIKTNTFKQFYLFYGEEKYMILQMKDQLKRALISEDDTMNYSYFEGKKVDPTEIIELAKTVPFFNDHRFIILDGTGLGKKSDDLFIKGLKEISDTSVLLFIEDTIDKRSKIYKFLSKQGHAACFEPMKNKELSQWITLLLKKDEKQMSISTMNNFLYRCGSDMHTLKNELDKLISYVGDRKEITSYDLEQLTSSQTINQIFIMLDAIARKQRDKVLTLYYDLIGKIKATMSVNATSLKLKRRQSTNRFVVTGLAKGDYISSWTSSNKKIVTVSGRSNGTCTIKAGNKTGKAKITITLASGLKKTINVTVQKKAVTCTSIKNVPKKLTLKRKRSYQLKPVINPIACIYKTKYKTSNKKIVKVTSKGKITAVKKGKAKITVMVGKKKFVCTVTIK